jgi:ADP-ribose pyrophosphatase
MSEMENLEWEEISCEHVVHDEWIDFRKSAYRFPDGSSFGPYYSYSRRDYVVIVATDEDGKYICVRQFRYGIKRVTTEFCAGGIERCDGKEYGSRLDKENVEDAIEAAKRELMEETGYESDDWKFLLSVPYNATMADNYANIFVAKNCRKVAGQNLDDTEFLNVHLYSREEIEAMIESGEFPQIAHIMAFMMADRDR